MVGGSAEDFWGAWGATLVLDPCPSRGPWRARLRDFAPTKPDVQRATPLGERWEIASHAAMPRLTMPMPSAMSATRY